MSWWLTNFRMYFSIPQKSVGTRFNWYRYADAECDSYFWLLDLHSHSACFFRFEHFFKGRNWLEAFSSRQVIFKMSPLLNVVSWCSFLSAAFNPERARNQNITVPSLSDDVRSFWLCCAGWCQFRRDSRACVSACEFWHQGAYMTKLFKNLLTASSR